jgi:hypothetical protein
VESKLGPLGTSATYWPTVPAPGDCEDGEFGGMNGRGNRSTRRKAAPTPLCPPQIPLDQTRDWNRAAAVGSPRLTASAMARPSHVLTTPCFEPFLAVISYITACLIFTVFSGLLVLPTLTNVGRPSRPQKMGNVKNKKSCILQYHFYTYQNRCIHSPAVSMSTDERKEQL